MINKLEYEDRSCCELCNDEWISFDCHKCDGEGIHNYQNSDNAFCMDCKVEFESVNKDGRHIYLKEVEK